MTDLNAIAAAQAAASNGNGAAASSGQTGEQALSKINRDLQEKATGEHAKALNLGYIDVSLFPVNPDILHLVLQKDAEDALLMPFFKSGNKLRVAVVDPEKPETKALLKSFEEKGFVVQLNLASASSLKEAFKLYASDQYKLKTEFKNVVKEEEIRYEEELKNLAQLKDQLEVLPAEESLNMLHVSAIKAGASDIHYQPEETNCALRFRIDGVLHHVFDISRELYERLANQLKYKAQMKLNITVVPQDGRFRFIVNDRKIDVRVASLPTEFGESFVCRILDSGKHFSGFAELGFSGRSLEILTKATELSQGMVLVTGPTSSGKTTTLYVLLTALNRPEFKIITLEDPIEYHLKGITQSQVNEKRGYSFNEGLRSILRQDPDVVMIGEIRDQETAEVCAQAALTGHVVLSTLHANSAVETIPRLITIGVPSFIVAPALSVVVAQRLTRKLCTVCKKEREAAPEEKKLFEKVLGEIKKVDPACMVTIPAQVKIPKGCDECNQTGFRGQMVISEVLLVDDEIEDAILKNKSTAEIFALARKNGMMTMQEDAMLKVIAGETTIDEVHRVINA